MEQTLDIVQTVILVIGFGLLAYWIKALKGTVEAQAGTIAEQKTFIENLATVLNATDAPKMLERYEALKKLLDHEKEALIAQYEKKIKQQQQVQIFVNSSEKPLLNVIAELMPFVPADKRNSIIQAAKLGEAERIRIEELAKAAPDLIAKTDEVLTRELKDLSEANRLRLNQALHYLGADIASRQEPVSVPLRYPAGTTKKPTNK